MNQDQEKEENMKEMYTRRNSLSIELIIGLVIIGVVVLVCLGALIYYFTQRKLYPEDPSAGQGAIVLLGAMGAVAEDVLSGPRYSYRHPYRHPYWLSRRSLMYPSL